MSRVGLINEPLSSQLNAPVKNANFIRPRAALPNASAYLELEMLSDFCSYWSKSASVPRAVKSSPWTTTLTSRVLW